MNKNIFAFFVSSIYESIRVIEVPEKVGLFCVYYWNIHIVKAVWEEVVNFWGHIEYTTDPVNIKVFTLNRFDKLHALQFTFSSVSLTVSQINLVDGKRSIQSQDINYLWSSQARPTGQEFSSFPHQWKTYTCMKKYE